MKWLVILVPLILCVVYVYTRIKQEKRIKKFFLENSEIKVDQLVTFSIDEFVKRIKKYPENKGKTFLVEFMDNKHISLSSDTPKRELVEALQEVQDFLVEKRYSNPQEGYISKDHIADMMLDVWVDYAHSKNYEDIFWRQMYRKLNEGEISDSTFNIIHEKFYGIRKEFKKFEL